MVEDRRRCLKCSVSSARRSRPKPSTRLSATDELPSVAANRGLEPNKLSGLVRGDLDWIVMKSLEKDRNRRYETANGLPRTSSVTWRRAGAGMSAQCDLPNEKVPASEQGAGAGGAARPADTGRRHHRYDGRPVPGASIQGTSRTRPARQLRNGYGPKTRSPRPTRPSWRPGTRRPTRITSANARTMKRTRRCGKRTGRNRTW